MARVPWALAELAERYGTGVIRADTTYRWLEDSFKRYLPEHGQFLNGLGPRLGRDQLVRLCGRIGNSEQAAVEAFVATMAWGFGTTARYGAYRTAEMLGTDDAPTKILAMAQAAIAGTPEHAFEVASANRLKTLGPAFWTKFLCFCSLSTRSESAGFVPGIAPILDDVVSRWVHDETGEWFESQSPKSAEPYRRFSALLDDWSAQLALRSDLVEELIFRSGFRMYEDEEVAVLDPRHGWNAEAVVDHQLLERFRYRFTGRADDLDAALDRLERDIRDDRAV